MESPRAGVLCFFGSQVRLANISLFIFKNISFSIVQIHYFENKDPAKEDILWERWYCRLCGNSFPFSWTPTKASTNFGGKGCPRTAHISRHSCIAKSLALSIPSATIAPGVRTPAEQLRTVTNLIVQCNLPIHIVKTPEWRQMMISSAGSDSLHATLCPETVMKDMKQWMDEVTGEVKDVLALQTSIALTLDTWTSRARERFIGIKGHFIVGGWNLETRVMALLLFNESHTAEAIRRKVTEAMQRLNVNGEKICGATTDNANNIRRAVLKLDLKGIKDEHDADELPEKTHIIDFIPNSFSCLPCTCHTLELCVLDSLKAVKEVKAWFDTIRDDVTAIRNHSAAIDHYRLLTGSTPILGVCTRWWSWTDAGQFYFNHQQAVIASLSLVEIHKTRFTVNSPLWSQLGHVLRILQKVAAVQRFLEGESYVTSSAMYPMVTKLTSIIGEYLRINLLTAGPVVSFAYALQEAIIRRFPWNEIHMTPWLVATMLDPAYRHNLTVQHLERAKSELKKIAGPAGAKLVAPQAVICSEDDPTSWIKLKTVAAPSIMTTLEAELQEYEHLAGIEDGKETLQWWSVHQGQFPQLSHFAREYLALQASSAAVERLFSASGAVCSVRRGSLSAETLEMICFLKSNSQLP